MNIASMFVSALIGAKLVYFMLSINLVTCMYGFDWQVLNGIIPSINSIHILYRNHVT